MENIEPHYGFFKTNGALVIMVSSPFTTLQEHFVYG